MVWKKLKKLIIPFFIVKLLIFVVFISRNDLISISGDRNSNSDYIEAVETDSLVLRDPKGVQIVRNDKEFGFSLKLRGKKNTKTLPGKETKIPVPIVD